MASLIHLMRIDLAGIDLMRIDLVAIDVMHAEN